MADLYISGLTGSFDTEGMVNKLLQIKQKPLSQLAQKRALVQGKVSSLNNLYGALSGMQNFFNNLDINSLVSSKKANSSNSNVLTATATKDAPNITMSITVNRVAQTEIRASNQGFSSLNDTFSSSGTMILKYWTDSSNSQSFNINYSAGQTLQDLVNSINSAQKYVKASVYYTGTDYRLLLSETDASNSTFESTSSNSAIEVENLPSQLGSLETIQNAQNASIKIGNSTTPVTSPSNTFNNLLNGLEVNVKETGSATITITQDFSKIDSSFNSFVTSYNSLVSLINQMTSKGAQFQGDSTIVTIKTGMIRMINPMINAGLIEYSDKDGTITINNQVLNNLKNSNPEKLTDILSNLKNNFSAQLTAWTGAINTYRNIGEGQITNINRKISELQSSLVKYEERLRKEYSQLEAFINKTNQISSRIQDFMTSLSEMTKGGK
ncbi:MAG: flagellar filament capping protein FliD [Thermodesulfovibrio sp.]|nr:flagellar filament capping protein FliD [Thermodesulfovibrio sp.]MDW7998283.1 flagellar filament capping protein FliD [Thermodesulfovibrio sp.]